MKKVLFVLLITTCVLRLPGQTNEPVRLALISESTEMSAAADVLTAELSGHRDLLLLERSEIEKLYREQGLSAGNKDYLKLGHVLGADGLLLIEPVAEDTNQPPNLPFAAEKPLIVNVRLVAAKPGVVLISERFSLFMKDLPDWSASFSRHLNLFIPKLAVLAKDAIPISVVNLRSAVSSADASEMERQLKSLTIQRLSREPELFVLERQRMQMLSEEKELKSDESAFWNGSYLLEGVVDQNGYSKDVITINARLAPPKGGQPLLFEVSGSRTNLAEVVNRLVTEVSMSLKINSTMKEWNAAEEAQQYYEEAKWALRWGAFSEAKMAAESAWALGKMDLNCAILRVKSYLGELSAKSENYSTLEAHYGAKGGYDAGGTPIGDFQSEAEIQSDIRNMANQHPWGLAYKETVDEVQKSKSVKYFFWGGPPDMNSIDTALYALNLYYTFSRNSPESEPKILWRGIGWNDWHNSDWYQLGIDDLVAASRVLQRYNFAPLSQKEVADKLSGLRASARSVAELIAKASSIHNSYFVRDRLATHDELSHTIEEQPNVFRCEVNWGCYWQERPEDGVALYRDLMGSPVFCYIHKDFWQREAIQPRLIAWNEADQKRIPQVWADFVRELNESTNVLLRMEAQALAMANAPNKAQAQQAQQEWWNIVRSNREDLVADNVELFYLGWGLAYGPETEAMDRDYWSKTVPAQKTKDVFEKQKQFLKANQPYDFMEFVHMFQGKKYSKAQALEIQPLLAAYKSNLVAQSQIASMMQKGPLRGAINQVGFLESEVSRILNPPAPAPSPSVPPVVSQPTLAAKSKPTNSISGPTPEIVTNVLLVKKFLPIPLDGLPSDKIAAVTITAHHWLEGKLVLDFQYGVFVYSFDANGNWQSTRNATFPAIAILDPATEHWQVISCPEMDITSQNRFYHHTTLCRGEVFTSEGGRIQKYDAAKNAWQVLDVSGVGNCELFTVNDHLYAATSDLILEILDGGARTHILASNRRQPPVSALDTESLGTPALFAGPGGSLRATAGNKMVAWDGDDWRAIGPAPQSSLPPVISDDGILFLADGWNAPAGIWHLTMGGDQIECWVRQKPERGRSATDSGPDKSPAWQLPPDISPLRLPAASRGPDLYLLVDHAKSQNIVNEEEHRIIGKKILPQNGYHAGLLCFAAHDPVPQKIFLKFDGDDARLPVTGDSHSAGFMLPNLPSSWLLFSTNYLFCGRETFGSIFSGVGSSSAMRTQTEIWMIPLGQIDSELARLRKIQQERQTLADAAARQAAQMLLEKYDRNHNGVIDVDEREAAFDDPVFIESELDKIDANHNGRLGAAELAYFDANTNKILEPKEQAGIEITQNLLAERFFKRFDTGEDGLLDRSEFNELYKSITENSPQSMSDFFGTPFAMVDQNHDSQIDLLELEKFLVQGTQDGLRSWAIPNSAGLNPMRTRAGQPVDQRQVFKAAVEFYWQNPAGITNRPPFRNGMPPGAGWDPGRMQQFPKP